MGFFQNLASSITGMAFRETVEIPLTSSDLLEIELVNFIDQTSSSSTPGVRRVPSRSLNVKSRGLTYFSSPFIPRDWVEPQYDHYELEVIFDIESYFAAATRKKLSLFEREGFEIVGSNDERVKYLRIRLDQIRRATGISFNKLLRQTCRDLIVHANAFWLKVRKPEASGGRVRYGKNGREIKPVAGYFPLPPETMIPRVDKNGNIVAWKQEIDSLEKIFKVEDIVHFFTNKKSGYPLGVPSIIPVKDDIRALRGIEANIDVLIHKHLFPIILWKVGLPQPGLEARNFADGTDEIDVVEAKIAEMPMEGSLVVSERYNVEAIGLENKALRVEPYLEHFLKRLLAGLDVSSVDVGIADTSNSSTAQTLSRNLIDNVKMSQKTIEDDVVPVFEELLMESTFSESTVLDEENLVHLKFYEIDKEAKIAEANHLVDLFLKNGITHPEFRLSIGKEPLLPEEEKELFWEKFGKKELLIRSIDESSGLGTSNSTLGGRPKESSATGGGGGVDSKNRPANQHGRRRSPKLSRDAVGDISTHYNPILKWHLTLAAELQARWIAGGGQLNVNLAEADMRTAYETAVDEFSAIVRTAVRNNYPDPLKAFGITKDATNRGAFYIRKLRKEIVAELKVNQRSPNAIFEAKRYRAGLIYDTELARAGNVARFRWFKRHEVDVAVVTADDACEFCKSQLTTIRWNDRLGEANVPPHHPGCACIVRGMEDRS